MISEKEFQSQIIQLAKHCGWMVYHQRPALSKGGKWLTALQGDKGFPDLVLAHAGRKLVIFAELKSEGGKVSPDQERWISCLEDALASHGRYSAVIWYPSDWEWIQSVLTGVGGQQ